MNRLVFVSGRRFVFDICFCGVIYRLNEYGKIFILILLLVVVGFFFLFVFIFLGKRFFMKGLEGKVK